MSSKKRKSSLNKKPAQTSAVPSNTVGSDKRAAKKAAVLGSEKKRGRSLWAVFTCVILVVGGIFFFINSKNKNGNFEPAASAQIAADQSVTKLTYPVTLFDDGNARYYEYKAANTTIKYFILKSSDGVIRAAFDACDVCWRAGKGYYQVGDNMICRNCGRQFASILVNEVKGGCNPAPLSRSIEGDNLVVRIKDILDGQQYFNFSGRT